jgi:uncharacterized protein
MPTSTCPFVWYDVMTTDTGAAEKFYETAIGWKAKDSGMNSADGGGYTLFLAGDTMVGGLMAIPKDARAAGVPPMWMGYLGVPDVDDYAKRVKAAGGKIMREPADIPNVGRFAVAADPDGAGFILFKPNSSEVPAPLPPGTPGTIGWHELHAGNGAKAFDFYSKLFGWTKTDAMDMGPMGTYQMFSTGDGPTVGGMMTKMAQAPMPYWTYYFNVDGVDTALKRIKDRGGEVLNGPMQVPGGQWIANCRDPQGAMFSIVSTQA